MHIIDRFCGQNYALLTIILVMHRITYMNHVYKYNINIKSGMWCGIYDKVAQS